MRSSPMGSFISSPDYDNCIESCEWQLQHVARAAYGVSKKLSYYSSVTGGPIVLRFGMFLGTH